MCIINIASAIKKMTVFKLRDFIFENCYKPIGFASEYSYCSMKHQKKSIYNCLQQNQQKIADPSNAKEYYNSYLKREKISKTIKNN